MPFQEFPLSQPEMMVLSLNLANILTITNSPTQCLLRITNYAKKISHERELRPAMYADVRANLSAESLEKLSKQPKRMRYHQDDNPYGMLKLILKTHSGGKTGWVTDKLDFKPQMFQLGQSKEETLLQYKN